MNLIILARIGRINRIFEGRRFLIRAFNLLLSRRDSEFPPPPMFPSTRGSYSPERSDLRVSEPEYCINRERQSVRFIQVYYCM